MRETDDKLNDDRERSKRGLKRWDTMKVVMAKQAAKEEQALEKKQARKEKKAQTQLAKKKMAIDVEIKPPTNDKDSGLKNKERYDRMSNDLIIRLAEACENNGKFVEARDLYSFAGERGSSEAIFKSGELAESGNLGTKDFMQAFDFFLSAAESGYVPAMEIVALNYFLGVGVEKDEMRAAAFIFSAHLLEPDLVKATFYKLSRQISSDTFDLGKAFSYSIFATSDQAIKIEAKVEAIRIKQKVDAIGAKEKAERLLQASRKPRIQDYNDNVSKRNEEGWDPVWIFPLLFIVFPLIMWLIRESRH